VREERATLAAQAAHTIAARGYLVYAPVVYGHAVDCSGDHPPDWDYWMRHAAASLLRNTDSLVVLDIDGWHESAGVRYEIELWQRVAADSPWMTYTDWCRREGVAHG
jgi:dienelactone hydrolase